MVFLGVGAVAGARKGLGTLTVSGAQYLPDLSLTATFAGSVSEYMGQTLRAAGSTMRTGLAAMVGAALIGGATYAMVVELPVKTPELLSIPAGAGAGLTTGVVLALLLYRRHPSLSGWDQPDN